MDVAGVRFDEEGVRLAVALGIGLLLGAERERRKGEGPARGAAGIRTFALVALAGGIAMAIGGGVVLAVALGFVALAVLAAYILGDRTDPGLTTEVAVIVTFLLGALAQQEPQLAAGIAVVVAILLAAREQLHRLVSRALTEQEVHDALLFAGAALVILPLAPNERIGPYGVFNPFAIWRLVVIVMAIGGAGYAAVRLLGARVGLPLSGLAAGFVSSSATIAAMGARARETPALRTPAVAAAVLSTVATVVQMVIVVGATDRRTLEQLWPAMAFAGVAAVGYGAIFALRALRDAAADAHEPGGRAFDLKTAVLFASTVTAVLFVSAALGDWLGNRGVLLSAAVAGFADTHAAAIAVAGLAAGGRVDPADAVVPILAAFTTNSVTKMVLSAASGGRRFAAEVWPGVIVTAALAWAGWALS
ncbi:MgtC/SapB family protein [Tepidiforma thermophila]|uniref:Uncharacterized membrane protein (DUF4010 family) n=1 Tax=Tepidiforma thermophila (strain KCTC 52669 / CGMCC 1.13589 / G233) TaxID=2761530 RepID=A0A2A9HDJ5_TEPT2|nr:DUF4010 domain-containing protein [Tepidiforma thermophila]PFG73221.1 uncharacterized membrane protein (DUF4010 family) [Tepidiforma thermophila]